LPQRRVPLYLIVVSATRTSRGSVIRDAERVREQGEAAGSAIRCAECGAESDELASGWRAYLGRDFDEAEDEEEVVLFCPDCASGVRLVRQRAIGVNGVEQGGGVGLFTVNFELGDKTRETLRQIANTSVVRFELGPETRAMIERLAAPREDAGGNREGAVGRIVEKGAKALRS
jgi:hypothetical protein